MKKLNNLITSIFLLTVVIVIYLLNFQNDFINSDHYICTEIKEYQLNNSTYQYPSSCDEFNYFEGFKNPESIIERNHPYQSRPVYIVSVYLISKLTNYFIADQNNLYISIAIIINHLIIFTTSLFLIKNAISVKNLGLINQLLLALLIINPIFKWGIFLPSNQTLSFLLTSLMFYTYKKYNNLNSYYFSFILGILILGYRPLALVFMVYLLLKYLSEKSKLDLIVSSTIFLLPWISYDTFIRFKGYTPYDDLALTWGQFRWLLNYIFKPINYITEHFINKSFFESRYYSSEWHCTSLPSNFICYFQDTLKVFIYIGVPIILVYFIIFKFNLLSWIDLKIIRNIFLIIYIFYSLIGWYPPLRFNLYSISNILFLTVAVVLLKHNFNFQTLTFSIGFILYFIGLNHWNSPEILEINLFITIGTLLMLLNTLYFFVLSKKSIL